MHLCKPLEFPRVSVYRWVAYICAQIDKEMVQRYTSDKFVPPSRTRGKTLSPDNIDTPGVLLAPVSLLDNRLREVSRSAVSRISVEVSSLIAILLQFDRFYSFWSTCVGLSRVRMVTELPYHCFFPCRCHLCLAYRLV